jgi:hypothetical protein
MAVVGPLENDAKHCVQKHGLEDTVGFLGFMEGLTRLKATFLHMRGCP